MKLTDADLQQGDALVFRLESRAAGSSIPSSLNVETEGWRNAARCKNCNTVQKPIMRDSAKHIEPIPVCPKCGSHWERCAAVAWVSPANAHSGYDFGARVTGPTTKRDGSPREIRDQRVYVNADRPHKGSTELRIFGRAPIRQLHELQRIEGQLWEGPYRWSASLYFSWVLLEWETSEGSNVARFIHEILWRGPTRDQWIDDWDAQQTEIDWAPENVRDMVAEGRAQWTRRLKARRVLWGEGVRPPEDRAPDGSRATSRSAQLHATAGSAGR